MRRKKRRLGPSPQGWGLDQLEQRAANARASMHKFDLMPPEYRALANEYGMKVRSLMADGWTPDQIKREFNRS